MFDRDMRGLIPDKKTDLFGGPSSMHIPAGNRRDGQLVKPLQVRDFMGSTFMG